MGFFLGFLWIILIAVIGVVLTFMLINFLICVPKELKRIADALEKLANKN